MYNDIKAFLSISWIRVSLTADVAQYKINTNEKNRVKFFVTIQRKFKKVKNIEEKA
jgi:desulfoferrodoxin (superoxide reductase-like protein)